MEEWAHGTEITVRGAGWLVAAQLTLFPEAPWSKTMRTMPVALLVITLFDSRDEPKDLPSTNPPAVPAPR